MEKLTICINYVVQKKKEKILNNLQQNRFKTLTSKLKKLKAEIKIYHAQNMVIVYRYKQTGYNF